MIGAFSSLSGSQPQFSVLAGHISQALVLTLLGIGLSVPAIFCHAFFKNRLTRISMDTANIADDLLTQMYHNSKKPAPGWYGPDCGDNRSHRQSRSGGRGQGEVICLPTPCGEGRIND